MNVTEFETQFYPALYEFFQEYEFEWLPQYKQFRRSLTRGFQNVIIATSEYDGECWVEVNIGIRHHAIETISQQFLDHLSDFQRESNTLITSIGRLQGKRFFRYQANDFSSTLAAADQLKAFMEEKGFSFLESIMPIESIHRLLNENPYEYCPYLYNQIHRCFKGLVVAHQMADERLTMLAHSYSELIGQLGAKPSHKASFEKLKDYLLHYYHQN